MRTPNPLPGGLGGFSASPPPRALLDGPWTRRLAFEWVQAQSTSWLKLSELPPACLSCGACCFSRLEDYVRVDGSDHVRLADRACDLTHFIGNRCYMKMAEGHCAALVIDVTTGLFVCSVYETRPVVCRDLERASPECRAEIHEKGERPRALLYVLGLTR